MSATSLPQRELGASGIRVAEIGLGCNRIGEDLQSDGAWIALLHRAADLGVTVYDTAAQYAGGRSEALIGRAFGNRDDVVIATKVSPVRDATPPFSRDLVIAGAESSLRELRRERIDVFQTHGGGSVEEIRDPEWAEAMTRLQEQGKIRLRAAAVFDARGGLHAIEHGLVDALQVTYNLIDSVHADPLLPTAAAHGVGLLARMPYQRGILTGKFSPDRADAEGHRAAMQGAKLEGDILRAEAFRDLAATRQGGMAGLAMQFVLAETRLSCTIPGARSIEQLEANIAAALAPPLTSRELADIAAIRDGQGRIPG